MDPWKFHFAFIEIQMQSSPTLSHSLQGAPPVPTGQPIYTPQQRVWSTGLCDCLSDEESCWWGTWCCCILSGRNSESYGFGSSQIQVLWVSVWVVVQFFLLVLNPALFFLGLLIGGAVYSYQRATVRTLVRQRFSIFGNFINDFFHHCCCACCTITQEAREAKVTNMPLLDYCSGQPLSELTNRDDEVPPSTSLALFNSLSVTGRLLVRLWLMFFLIIVLASIFSPLNLVILFIVFAQPVLILYVLYWQRRRRYAQLDNVIKLFTVGFFMSTTQSLVLEEILQSIILFIAIIVFAIFNPGVFASSDDNGQPPENMAVMILDQWKAFGNHRPSLSGEGGGLISSEQIVRWASSMVPLLQSVDGIVSTTAADNGDSSGGSSSGTTPTAGNDQISSIDVSVLQNNFFLIIIVLLLMAFVVAAGVEETTKHFALRCCRLPNALRDPQAVLVYLVAAALGFACAENLEYVFGAKSSPIHGISLFVSELFILVLRLLMPIHFICAVLQAAQLSKNVAGIVSISLPMILFPAILLHGSFDFFLFLLSAIQAVFQVDNVGMDILSFAIPLLMTVGGAVWAYRSFKQVESLFQENWRPVGQEDVENPVLTMTADGVAL